jgi:hypothetical protein
VSGWVKSEEKRLTNVMYNPRILICIRARKPHSTWQLHLPIARDFNLHAIRVELRAATRIRRERHVGFMQGDKFGADQITNSLHQYRKCCGSRGGRQPGFQARRNAHVHVAVVLLEIGGCGPGAGLGEGVGSIFA